MLVVYRIPGVVVVRIKIKNIVGRLLGWAEQQLAMEKPHQTPETRKLGQK